MLESIDEAEDSCTVRLVLRRQRITQQFAQTLPQKAEVCKCLSKGLVCFESSVLWLVWSSTILVVLPAEPAPIARVFFTT